MGEDASDGHLNIMKDILYTWSLQEDIDLIPCIGELIKNGWLGWEHGLGLVSIFFV